MKNVITIIFLCLFLGCNGKSESRNNVTVQEIATPTADTVSAEGKENQHPLVQDAIFENELIEPAQANEADFEINEDGVIVKYTGPSNIALVIPPSINGITITGIASKSTWSSLGEYRSTFSNRGLSSVTIPNTITYIGSTAFSHNRLRSVIIPTGVTFIGAGAFERNTLTSVVIPDTVTIIDMRAFQNNQLTSIVIPESVTNIYIWAFENNPITRITIGANVELEDWRKEHYLDDEEQYTPSFDNKFGDFYNDNGRQAGTYVFENGQWIME
jgi:hypothetical protein